MHVVPDLDVAKQNTVTEDLLGTKLNRGSLGGREVTVAEDERLEFRRMLLNTLILRPPRSL